MDPTGSFNFSLGDDDNNMVFGSFPQVEPSSSWGSLGDDDVNEVFNTLEHTSGITQGGITQGAGSSSQNPLMNVPGPAGIIQDAKRRKAVHNNLAPLNPMTTQECIREILENPEEDNDFNCIPWVMAKKFAYPDGGCSDIVNIRNNLVRGKIDLVVAVIKTCAPNVVGDLSCMLKDTTGEVPGTIHYKILDEVKGICVGCVLVIQKVSVFIPNRREPYHALNITKKNLVRVFYKDGSSAAMP